MRRSGFRRRNIDQIMSENARERELGRIDRRLAELAAERRELESARAALLEDVAEPRSVLTQQAAPQDKITLFRSLFRGRTDVYPVRWENQSSNKSGYAPACSNEWVRGVCAKPRIKCGDCSHQAFIAVSNAMIERHLRGDIVAGVYPLLPANTCYFVAVDFDGEGWAADSGAFVHACISHHVPVGRERSRSGAGAHAWIFFKEAVVAARARQLATALMSEAMELRPEIAFNSYDRLFPSQDLMPQGGFGNLIALPLQREARDRGHSVFIDDALNPYPDQWAYLALIQKIDGTLLESLVRDLASRQHGATGIRLPTDDEDSQTPWAQPEGSKPGPHVTEPLPKRIIVTLADQIYIDRTALPASMVTRLLRLAAFQNPAFYKAQAMRFPNFDKPRVISCAALHPHHIELPRGCLDEVQELLDEHGVRVDLSDKRNSGDAIKVNFVGTLRPDQQKAAKSLLAHDCGVLAATTAFGKTVLAIALIAARGRNVLILVHRQQLLDQWVEQLRAFLDVEPDAIGIIGGGKKRLSGKIDVALIQSLVRKHAVDDCVLNYGHLVVDECHHVSATSFEAVTKRARARYVLGLSATVTRKDGHHPIIFMQCGPVRYRVTARAQLTARGGMHRAEQRETEFRADEFSGSRIPIATVYRALAESESRNTRIFDDVLRALEAGRHPLVLTERRDHLERLAIRFGPFVGKIIVFRGGMSARDRDAALASLRSTEPGERLVLATGRYLGEGFDYARLDTLFLTLPISWKGTLAQYVGRLHREHVDKSDVLVVDYVDLSVPMLARMAMKRQAGYRSLGYVVDAVPQSVRELSNRTRVVLADG
jgi:superfamily II DNA or RNA helicase